MDTTTDFATIWASVAHIEGWLTEAQARRLHERARGLRAGQRIVEIGSYRGRSTIVLSKSAPAGVEIIAIDPHAGNDRGPLELEGPADKGQYDHERFLANLAEAGASARVRHVREASQTAHGAVHGEVDLLFIDGSHRYRPALDDIRAWGARVRPGGLMLIHDSFNATGVMAAQLRSLVFGRDFRYLQRSTSLSEYRREPLTGEARVKNSLVQLLQLGYFAQSSAIKAAILAKQPRLGQALGHHNDAPWPH